MGLRNFTATFVVENSPSSQTTRLTAILGPKKGIPSLAAARLQRWAVTLRMSMKSHTNQLTLMGMPTVTLDSVYLKSLQPIVKALPFSTLNKYKPTSHIQIYPEGDHNSRLCLKWLAQGGRRKLSTLQNEARRIRN